MMSAGSMVEAAAARVSSRRVALLSANAGGFACTASARAFSSSSATGSDKPSLVRSVDGVDVIDAEALWRSIHGLPVMAKLRGLLKGARPGAGIHAPYAHLRAAACPLHTTAAALLLLAHSQFVWLSVTVSLCLCTCVVCTCVL